MSFLNADEIRPSYLQITEKQSNTFFTTLKVPAKEDKKLALYLLLPDTCADISTHNALFINGSYIERWRFKCENGLVDKKLLIQGLENTRTDLLLRMEFLDKTSQIQLLTPSKNWYRVKKSASSFEIIKTYTWLGITHILLGFDHLLFVLALLLIVKDIKRLLLTITAFTVAHSITMAGATLGYVYIWGAPIEAVIALSVLFLAMELIHEKNGRIGLAIKHPWLIAFIFGLLHGFGFAGALAEIGVPEQAITLALLFFNIGVEFGQILFVITIIILSWIFNKIIKIETNEYIRTVIIYLIGGLSAFWLFERVYSF